MWSYLLSPADLRTGQKSWTSGGALITDRFVGFQHPVQPLQPIATAEPASEEFGSGPDTKLDRGTRGHLDSCGDVGMIDRIGASVRARALFAVDVK